jgi:hypothetical protein
MYSLSFGLLALFHCILYYLLFLYACISVPLHCMAYERVKKLVNIWEYMVGHIGAHEFTIAF